MPKLSAVISHCIHTILNTESMLYSRLSDRVIKSSAHFWGLHAYLNTLTKYRKCVLKVDKIKCKDGYCDRPVISVAIIIKKAGIKILNISESRKNLIEN